MEKRKHLLDKLVKKLLAFWTFSSNEDLEISKNARIKKHHLRMELKGLEKKKIKDFKILKNSDSKA